MSDQFGPLNVIRSDKKISPDESRVIARLFEQRSTDKVLAIIDRVLKLPRQRVESLLNDIKTSYKDRHRDFEDTLDRHFRKYVAKHMNGSAPISAERRMLLGAYFTMEYSVESTALFNPSIVPHPDQSGISEGSMRFIMSFRAIGEGHLSSIIFRTGIITPECELKFDTVSGFIETPELHEDALFDKRLFELKLLEMGDCNEITAHIFERLEDQFTIDDLQSETEEVEQSDLFSEIEQKQTCDTMLWLAISNYEMKFRSDRPLSERVIFPVSENERNGIEDARFVQFTEECGATTYYATYTAYNGVDILPQLIHTDDFEHFRIITLNGKAVQNKGMALFPRKIDDQYVMISRQDGVNLHIMRSNHLHFWQEAEVIQCPECPWELVQIGNCGSPLETEAGWLLLTHGVGPMRKYCIGADLLDIDDPSRVIAHLDEPLLAPNDSEREGYVPNVVYTCGSIIHQGQLVVPYAMADAKCSIATVPMDQLLGRLLSKSN
jgi:predicted GH43/DUF377 family glycosyl hydrolase